MPISRFFQNFSLKKKNIRADMIRDYIRQLSSLGTRPALGRQGVAQLKELHEQGDFVGMVRFIKNDLKLSMRLRVCFVQKGGLKDCAAWIGMPNPVPLYATKGFEEMLVTLYIPESYARKAPFESVVDSIAHELCHVILGSTLHPLRDCEEAVDLAAMILGYRNFSRKGCMYKEVAKSANGSLFQKMVDLLANAEIVHLIGYLNPDEVRFAADLIDEEYVRQTKSRPKK